ncbi:hypothetical protein AMELA_G00128060 [Ameiurus melas]|uniref:Uncharacterized protein n=1 Tax=Ameiurus melas TaxID=219545 RepID=A0A7J6AQU4_AMEME|nr:hypothetical protein AMELA_G00128060 [Ameiurus melas]
MMMILYTLLLLSQMDRVCTYSCHIYTEAQFDSSKNWNRLEFNGGTQLPAPVLRNTKLFNVKNGCDFCLHYGGGPCLGSHRTTRGTETWTDHIRHAMLATPAKPVMHAKDKSSLMQLESFNMITGFVPEHQHSVWFGVTKQVTSPWLDRKHRNEDRYLGSKVSYKDKRLMAINSLLKVTMALRSTKDRKFWKGSEWRSFLLFCALPVLNGI